MSIKDRLLKIIYVLFIYSLPIFSQVNIVPYIKITSPNGGEKWEAYSTQTITWESINISNVKLEYSYSNGLSWRVITTSVNASLGKYSWTIPNSQVSQVLIRILDASNPFVYDVSDKWFTIFKTSKTKKTQGLNKTTTQTNSDSIKIMPLGDSITDGVGDDPRGVSYRKDLFDALTAAGYKFRFVGTQEGGLENLYPPESPPSINDPNYDFWYNGRYHEGHGGWVADGAPYGQGSIEDNINSWLTTLRNQQPHPLQPNDNNEPDIILLHVGTNDYPTDDEETIKNDIVRILDDINGPAGFNSNIQTVFATLIYDGHELLTKQNSLNSLLQIEANNLNNLGRNVSLVDMYSVLDKSKYDAGPGIYFSIATPGHEYNDLHPSGEGSQGNGYELMANAWFNALQNYYKPVLATPIATPSNGASNQPVNLTITWNEPPAASEMTTVEYELQVSDVTDFSNIVFENSSIPANSFSPTGLNYGTTYYWRVRITNYGWSDVWSFTTAASCPGFLISYWKLDETSGTTYHDYIAGNDGTAVNVPAVVTGQIGGAQSFDGVNDEISVPSNLIFNWGATDSFSFEFWMKDATSASIEVIIGRKNEVSSNLQIWVGLEDGNITFSVRSKEISPPPERDGSTVTGPFLGDDSWHHVAAVRDAATNELRIYVDGALENTASSDIFTEGFDASSSLITIGWLEGTSPYAYNGIIDEMAVYNAALSPTQIQNDYNKGLTGLGYCDEVSAPIITSSPVIDGFVGQLYSYDVNAIGNPSPSLYELTLSPFGMAINNSTGEIQWTPTSIGDFSVTVSASNGIGSPAIQSFTITVKAVPECPLNMIAYWKLNETSGTTYYDIIAGNDGTAVNAPLSVTGQIDGAQSFDGVNDEISVPSNGIFNWGATDSFSFEFWMHHSTSIPPEGSGPEVIIGRRNDVSSRLSIWIGVDETTGYITFYVRSKRIGLIEEAFSVQGPSLTDGLWHHVAAVRDAATNKLMIYVDGAFENEISTTYTQGFDAPSSPITIGWFNISPYYYFNGLIDELAIYNSALSPAQIQNDYIKGLLGKDYCDPLLLLASKVFLEGPYDAATSDVMFTNINSIIPPTSPYSQNPRTVSAIPADVVDWVLVELRSNLSGPAVVSKSVFLHKDGNLVADDGINHNIFMPVAPGNYYIVIKHRNHLGIMSAAPPVTLSTSATFYDFTSGSDKFFGGNAGAKLIDTSPNNVWGMIAGDANKDGNITTLDYDLWLPNARASVTGYGNTDINLDGQNTTLDYDLWLPNARAAKSSQVP